MGVRRSNKMVNRAGGVTEIYAKLRGEEKIILVDTEDLPKIFPHPFVYWYLDDGNTHEVPIATSRSYTQGKRTYMHRVIMEAKKGQMVFHVGLDELDNRKSNLTMKDTKAMEKEDA